MKEKGENKEKKPRRKPGKQNKLHFPMQVI